MADLQVARLVATGLAHHCPVTHQYALEGGEFDGQFVLVTVKDPDVLAAIFAKMSGGTDRSHVEPNVDVFLTDERAETIIDADGNPENGMNPIASTDPQSIALRLLPRDVSTHAEALAALGYRPTSE